MSSNIVDAQARAAALDPTLSFCVQAPAGSGKTELLTQRILKLLAHCEQPEEVLAFTFTRKAAAEMRNRLLSSLAQASQLDTAQLSALAPHKRSTLELARAVLAKDAALDWQLLQNSQRLRINTIDSFTSWLTARLPLAAGFGSRPQISTDMQSIFERAVRETLSCLNSTDITADQVASLLRHLHGNLEKAEKLLMELLYKRDQWLPLVAYLRSHPQLAREMLERNLTTLLDELTDEASQRLRPYANEIMQLLQYAALQLANNADNSLQQYAFTATLPDASAQSSAAWQALAKVFLLSDAGDFRKKVTKLNGFPGKSTFKDKTEAAQAADMQELFAQTVQSLRDAGLLPLLQRLALMPPSAYSDRQWSVLADLVALLPLLAAQLNTAMSAEGVIDHTQTSLAALTALGSEQEPSDLALLLDYRIRHILVDEFQDTSSMQFELLKRLTAGWTDGDGRTLFIVGDGMQSCYGFRNANVGLFLRAREQVGTVLMELLQLEVNFRSTASVVNWVNQVFSGAFPPEDDIARGGVSYSPSTASNQSSVSSAVSCLLHLIPEAELELSLRRRIEADAVALYCSMLQQQHPDDSIAILVRNRSILNELVPALRRSGLRWNAEAIDPLLSYPAINDLYSLLRALINPADITAWLAVLRCPFAGLSLADLEILASVLQNRTTTVLTILLHHEQLSGLSQDASQRLQRIVPAVQKARQLLQRLPLAELLENLWLELGGPACLEDSSMLENISSFLQLLESASTDGDIVDIHQFDKQLRSCYGSTVDRSVRLQIMTIHKAKGLEFDHVILPGLDRKGRSNSSALLRWQEYVNRQQHALPLLGLVASKGAESDQLYQYLKQEAALRDRLETTRLLYVAVTRAIKSARLFGTITAKKDGYKAESNSLLDTILPQLLSAPDALQVLVAEFEIDSSPVTHETRQTETTSLKRLPAAWQPPHNVELLPVPQAIEPEEPTHDLLAASIGELVHLALQTIVQHGQKSIDLTAPPALWYSKLRPLGLADSALKTAINTIAEQITNCLTATQAQWLFNTVHHEDACELSMTDYSRGYRRDHTIDRTFIDSDGVRWIIDYKSSTPALGQSQEEFMQEQSDRYRAQLQTYDDLFRHDLRHPVKLALFFTALPALHLLSPA